MKNFYFLAVAVYLLVGCTKSEEPNYSQNAKKRTFSVSLENNQTRAHAENLSVVWDNGDLMSILEGGNNFQYKYDASNQNIVAVNGAAGDGEVYAVYPYAESNAVVDDVISLTFPADQNYYADSFGLGANTMVAKSSDDNLSFKNVGSYLKLYLWGDDVTVQSITLKGNSDAAQLSGTALVSFDSNGLPVYEWNSDVEDGSKTITLNCPNGVTLGTSEVDATPFWIVVPPQTFTGGFTITVTDIEGKEFVQSTAKNVVLDRNYVQPMTAIEVVPTQPADEVWVYDINGNKVVMPLDDPTTISVLGFLPIDISDPLNPSGENLDDRMSIVKMVIPEGVTTLDMGALAYCTNLEEITLPSTLTTIGYGAFGACMSLESIEIPEGVETIGEGAFLQCI